ncbi:MAG: hypothetical protein J6T12_10205 [Salinivirgaceae bacterium]|nr:hypothetical protein [Salinivirgaceae bacterium]
MADRHKKGYYAEYAKRTGKKDRHRKGYYKEYNKAHPERLKRVGINVDYDNKENIDFYLTLKETQWHDDDWHEGCHDEGF